jgi:hypothetical protein
MNLIYNGRLFSEATARRLAADFNAVIESVGLEPGERIHGFRLGQAPTRPNTERVAIELGL